MEVIKWEQKDKKKNWEITPNQELLAQQLEGDCRVNLEKISQGVCRTLTLSWGRGKEKRIPTGLLKKQFHPAWDTSTRRI